MGIVGGYQCTLLRINRSFSPDFDDRILKAPLHTDGWILRCSFERCCFSRGNVEETLPASHLLIKLITLLRLGLKWSCEWRSMDKVTDCIARCNTIKANFNELKEMLLSLNNTLTAINGHYSLMSVKRQRRGGTSDEKIGIMLSR